jgi:UDP-N-acetylglucosamine 4,6-dehydratase/5-epimerase
MEDKRKDILNGSSILVTGGTGSFGNEIIQKLLAEYELKQITIYSRDEKKQYDMRNLYGNNPRLRFIIGDVRNRVSVFQAMKGHDFVFHAAALKQVPTCEFFPWEAVQTNISGANNVLDAAEECGVKKVVILSTDKAVYPINAMGMTKALMEKLMLAKARISTSGTVFCGVRYGNVMYSRGSVFPLFVEQIRQGKPLTITHADMTRYLLPLPVAIELVLFALENGTNGDLLVRKAPAATVRDMAEATAKIFNYSGGIQNIGIREGEKMHETLVTREELMKAEEYDHYYRIRNLSQIDYTKFFSDGDSHTMPSQDYTSENTSRLTLAETETMVRELREIKVELKKG